MKRINTKLILVLAVLVFGLIGSSCNQQKEFTNLKYQELEKVAINEDVPDISKKDTDNTIKNSDNVEGTVSNNDMIALSKDVQKSEQKEKVAQSNNNLRKQIRNSLKNDNLLSVENTKKHKTVKNILKKNAFNSLDFGHMKKVKSLLADDDSQAKFRLITWVILLLLLFLILFLLADPLVAVIILLIGALLIMLMFV